MELVPMIIISVCWLGIGFCMGHAFQLKHNLAKLAELHEGLDRVKRLSAEADACAEACIKKLEQDNCDLRRQLAMYRTMENFE